MKLNHINLAVTEVAEAQRFLEVHFGLRAIFGNTNLAVLSDDDGLVLSLTSMKLGGETAVRYPANFHIGFSQESAAQVDAIHQKLRAAGVEAPAPSRQHGAWTFYFQAPGGFTVEILGPLEADREAGADEEAAAVSA